MDTDKKIHLENFWHNPNWQPPVMIYGKNLIAEATDTDEKYAVITMEIPWDLVKNEVVRKPETVVFVPNVHLSTLVEMESRIPQGIEMVIGIGGGSCHDAAKYIALRRQIRLIQMPTIFGGDSVVCNAIGVRDERRVKYIGHTLADKIFVDFDVIRKAPPDLVRYGAADILSSFTGLMDWAVAGAAGKAAYDPKTADFAKNVLLKRLLDSADEIRNITDEGIKTIIELFLEYAKLANQIDSDMAQEGSEHYFCYNAEYVTRRSFIHGKLLALGIWISGGFFHGKEKESKDALDSLGLEYSLASAGLSGDEFRDTILTLDKFTREGGYAYSVFNEIKTDDRFADHLLTKVT